MDNQDYFDFTSQEEMPEQQSSQTKPCPHCSKPISTDSLFCLYCGEPVSPARRNKWVIFVVVFVLIAFMLWLFS